LPGLTKDDREISNLKAILDVLGIRPFYGYRKVARQLPDLGVTCKQVRRIMKRTGLWAIYAGKRTDMPSKHHRKYSYLLRDKNIWLPNQAWATDITYIERFWQTLKYEVIHLNDYRTLAGLKTGIKRYMGFYNRERFHASHDYLTPDQMYESKFQEKETGLCAVAQKDKTG